MSPTGKDGQGIGVELLRIISSDKHTASIVAGVVVAIGRVAGNIARHSCRGCFAWLLRLPSNIGMSLANKKGLTYWHDSCL